MSKTRKNRPAETGVRPREFTGTCVITWPRPTSTPNGVLAGRSVALTDDKTGTVINTVMGATVHLHVSGGELVWADLTMFADGDGKPIYDGTPVIEDGEIVTRTFPFLVTEMRVADPP